MRVEGDRRRRFWRWVHALAERRLRALWMERMKHDRRCPNCDRWGAVGGFDWAGMRRVDDWHDALRCTACGHESLWFMGSMLPIAVSKPAVPGEPLPALRRRP